MQVLAARVTFGESRPICLSWEHPVISEKVQWGGLSAWCGLWEAGGLGSGCWSSDVRSPLEKGRGQRGRFLDEHPGVGCRRGGLDL